MATVNPQQDLLSQSWTLPDQDKPESDEGGMWVAVLNFEGVTVRKACADADYLETPFYQWVYMGDSEYAYYTLDEREAKMAAKLKAEDIASAMNLSSNELGD